MSSFVSGAYWVDLAERTVRSFAVTLAAGLTTKGIQPINELPWISALTLAGTAAVLSILAGLGATAIPGSAPNTASFLPPPTKTAARVKAVFTRSGDSG